MSEPSFDPYISWLGIRSPNRPPNYYELLGLEELETDEDLIAQAVEKQAAILQMVTGDHVELAKELLGDVGQARIHLTDPEKKAVYDQSLGSVPSLPRIETGRESAEDVKSRSDSENIHPPPVPKAPAETGSVPDLNSDMQSSRIEAQRVKEQNDQKMKVIIDRLVWASCGICLVAIIWVMIVRVSGCQSGSVRIDQQGREDETPVQSQKLRPEKRLDRSLESPLEKKAKKLLGAGQQDSQGNKTRPSVSGGKEPSGKQAFQTIDQTFGLYDFNQPVQATDLLDGLAPLRLSGVEWARENGGGFIRLTNKSYVTIDRANVFDKVKKLTIICRL